MSMPLFQLLVQLLMEGHGQTCTLVNEGSSSTVSLISLSAISFNWHYWSLPILGSSIVAFWRGIFQTLPGCTDTMLVGQTNWEEWCCQVRQEWRCSHDE